MNVSEGDIFVPPSRLKTAVLFLVFNRLKTTQQVFESIRCARPPRLYIASDGPRADRNELERVVEVRDYITSRIDWDCEVKTLFRDDNLGCRMAVSGAIDWFFASEESGIILEDDCLPSQSFFWFCEELLERYRDDLRVWHIGGVCTLTQGDLLNQESYYFSRFNHIWGWAGWSNRWEKYDVDMSLFEEFQQNYYIENITGNKMLQEYWVDNFRGVWKKRVDTWDYQWYFSTWINGGLSIIPTVNLVSNIGFGADATHTQDANDQLSNMKRSDIKLNMIHPLIVMPNVVYDKYNAENLFRLRRLGYYFSKIKGFIKCMIKRNE